MQKRFDKILQKRMDRKDFLKHIGLGVAIMTGAAGLVKMLNSQQQGDSPQTARTENRKPSGYGAAAYGGNPARPQNS